MIEEHENQETSLQDLIDLVERDDLPTNEFTIEDKDPMVILGKLNEVIANLETLDNNINTTDSKANEALQNATQALNVANGVDAKATQATTDATQALNVANGVDAKATQATTDATQALTKATQATADATQALTNAVEAVGTANTALSATNSAVSYNEQTPTSAEQTQAQKNIGINNLFIKGGLADINTCSDYEQLYTTLSNSPNGTGVGSIGYASQAPIRTLLPAIPFPANFVNVYAKIIAGNDNNAWVIELSTIDLYSNGQTIPTYNLQIGKNIVDGVATYRVSKWYNPAGKYEVQKGIVTWSATRSHTQPITFPQAFSSVPTVVCTAIGVDNVHTSNICGLIEVTKEGFKFAVYGFGNNDKSIGAHWIAIGG